MALIPLIDWITEALDQGSLSCVYFVISIRLFTPWIIFSLKKLDLYGANDIALKCFDSYQSNILQYVSYINVEWDNENVKCGVPQ